jgi:hypothetical protein
MTPVPSKKINPEQVLSEVFHFILDELIKMDPKAQRAIDAKKHKAAITEMMKPALQPTKPVPVVNTGLGSMPTVTQTAPKTADKDPSFGGQDAGHAGPGVATNLDDASLDDIEGK